MGVFDKLKNALFEVEYVEVEEKPKKEKFKPREKTKNEAEEKPIAKKIVLPGKREEKVEEIKEEEMVDDNFEIRPINETIKESAPAFKFMDDDDFEMDNERFNASNRANDITSDNFSVDNNSFDYDDTNVSMSRSANSESRLEQVNDNPYDRPIHASSFSAYDDEEEAANNPYISNTNTTNTNSNFSSYDRTTTLASSNTPRESKAYGGETTTFKAAKEYGSYENKDEKPYFKPSPIISPIYGILDKNYRKEDVVSKKDIRITTSYSRSNVNVDDVRNKAYGRRSSEVSSVLAPEPEVTSFEIEDDEDESLLVDLSDEKEKPEVKSITVGDAMEYFDDLGLEYNVDYVDATNKNKRRSNDLEEDIKYNMDAGRVAKPIPAPAPVPQPEIIQKKEVEVKEKGPIVDIKEESKSSSSLDDDDNLFDLIDSMYKDED